MRRFILIVLLALVTLLAVITGAAVYVVNDEELLKSQLASLAHRYTGRELVISGPLHLDLGRTTSLSAGDITFSNPQWAATAHMVSVGHLEISLDAVSLFKGPNTIIPHLAIKDCTIDLVSNEQGQANWEMLPEQEDTEGEADDKPFDPAIRILEALVDNCQLTLNSPQRTEPLRVDARTLKLERQAGRKVTFEADGAVNADSVSVQGWIDPIRAFIKGGPVEHELSARIGDVSLRSEGTIADARALTGADIHAEFKGPAIEKVLDLFSLPHFTTGAFDFKLGLDESGGMTRLDVDGNLGTIDLDAKGQVDRLFHPSAGTVTAHLTGPDLQSLGLALGVEGLLPAPYSFRVTSHYEGAIAHLSDTVLTVQQDELEISGDLGIAPGIPNTDLNVRLQSPEPGRWAPLFGQPAINLGEVSVEGKAAVDEKGVATIDARADALEGQLTVAGLLGTLTGPLEPDLQVQFDSQNARPLFTLLKRPGFPEAPISLASQLRLEEQRLHISGLKLEFAGQHGTVDGFINLTDRMSGSDLDISLDIDDLDRLGQMFNQQDWPSQPLKLTGELKPKGRGLAFRVDHSSLGEISLKLDGRIEDLERPLGMDANFEVKLPSLDVLSVVLPDKPLPRGAFSASGQLHNNKSHTQLQGVNIRLGEMQGTIAGELFHDNRFDLKIEAQGPDASQFNDLIGQPLDPLPFSIRSELKGDRESMVYKQLQLKLGKSDVTGDLELKLGDTRSVNADLSSNYLDLRKWASEAEAASTEEEQSDGTYVFGDEPVLRIEDFGWDVDLKLRAEELDLGNTQLLDIDLGLNLHGNRLELNPFSLRGKGGGQFSGTFVFDERQGTPALDIDFHARNLRAGLGSNVGQDTSTWPPGDIDIVIDGSGRTRREMATTLNGQVRVSYGSGLMSLGALEFLMSDFVTELISTLNPFAETSEYTELECAVGAADIVNGKVEVIPVIFQTKQVTILSQGNIDLHTEKVDLSFNSTPRKGLGLSASTLINPFIKVGGQLKSPEIQLDPKNTVVSGGLAVATVGLSILAKSMSDRFLSSKDPCGDALEEIKEREAAKP